MIFLALTLQQKHASLFKTYRLPFKQLLMKHLFTLTAFYLISIASFAQQKSILFIGNSYTYTASLPGTLYNLAAAGGDTIYHESSTPGGYTYELHSTNNSTLTKIASRDWDYVVLQEQSQKPSFPPAQVASETYPYAAILVDSIKSNYECTEPVFFMTWGRRDGDQQNCQFYPPLCTFEGMNGRLRESYLEMGQLNDATVAPCGAAWYQMKLENSTFWNGLYSGDGSHPSQWGTYLNACVFYATIFRQSPVGIPYYANIGQQDAEDLQQLAEDIVLDSLSSWYIGHQDVNAIADYSSAQSLTVNFSQTSENATTHSWNFGDGNTSTDENPAHTYSGSGTYDVEYIASSNCGSDTTDLQVVITVASVEDQNPLSEISIVSRNGMVEIQNPTNEPADITILDLSGRMLFKKQINSGENEIVSLSDSQQLYIVRLVSETAQLSKRIVSL